MQATHRERRSQRRRRRKTRRGKRTCEPGSREEDAGAHGQMSRQKARLHMTKHMSKASCSTTRSADGARVVFVPWGLQAKNLNKGAEGPSEAHFVGKRRNKPVPASSFSTFSCRFRAVFVPSLSPGGGEIIAVGSSLRRQAEKLNKGAIRSAFRRTKDETNRYLRVRLARFRAVFVPWGRGNYCRRQFVAPSGRKSEQRGRQKRISSNKRRNKPVPVRV